VAGKVRSAVGRRSGLWATATVACPSLGSRGTQSAPAWQWIVIEDAGSCTGRTVQKRLKPTVAAR
jgi:hypothetical protein